MILHSRTQEVDVVVYDSPEKGKIGFQPQTEDARDWIDANVSYQPEDWVGETLYVQEDALKVLSGMVEFGLLLVKEEDADDIFLRR